MTLLTNLYKDPELAVIREYYTNALDAHVAAGVTDKHVLVTLPSWDSPTYVVQDFGVGMSEEDIKNIYAQYGASTKRNTNDQVGAFGLGCKSALTIATQFTVVSVKDGMKTTALISKTESGVNTINIINSMDTLDGNGTTVKIPVPDQFSFNNKANRFFIFSAPGLVKVNGSEPKHVLDGLTEVKDSKDDSKIVYLAPNGYGASYLIMGNVGYELSNNEVEASLTRLKRESSRTFVNMPKYFPVPIGSVDLTPSREGLRFTDKTMDLIDELMTFMLMDLERIGQEEIDKTTTLPEYWEVRKKWDNIMTGDRQNIWKGKRVPHWIESKEEMRTIERSDYHGSSHSQSTRFSLKNDSRIIVRGYPATQYKKVNSYLTPYMTSQNLDDATFVITNDPAILDNEWLALNDKWTIVHGDDIITKGREQRKKDRAAASTAGTSGPREKVHYPVAFLDDSEIRWVVPEDVPDDSPYLMRTHIIPNSSLDILVKNLYYYNLNTTKEISEIATDSLGKLTNSRTVILMGGGRSESTLLTRVPTTYPITDDAKETSAKAEKLITPEVLAHYSVTKSAWQHFLKSTGLVKRIDAVKDKKIKAVIVPEEETKKAYKEAQSLIDSLGWASLKGVTIPSMDISGTKDSTLELTKKYPLVDAISTWQLNDRSRDHIVTYLNAVHAEVEAKTAAQAVVPATV
jgi:hypothetical protein